MYTLRYHIAIVLLSYANAFLCAFIVFTMYTFYEMRFARNDITNSLLHTSLPVAPFTNMV